MCGQDEKLQAELESRGFGTVIGWTDEMPALMTAADALVENAGGLTCMEAFAVGLPVITYLPIAGHGKDNAEMMARSGVNHYARDEDELHERLRAVTAPGPARQELVDAARGLFRGDPADDVDELAASTHHLVDRKGRVVAFRTPRGRKSLTVAAASLVVLYVGLTVGAQAVSAIGVGVAKPPANVHRCHLHRCAARRRPACRPPAPGCDPQPRRLGGGRRADADGTTRTASTTWRTAGVDIANGGWGKGTLLPLEPGSRTTSTRPAR